MPTVKEPIEFVYRFPLDGQSLKNIIELECILSKTVKNVL